MKYGFVLTGGDVTDAADLGAEAERAGWDGFFAYEPTWGIDAWVVLVSGLGVAALSALGSSLAWPLGWILAGLLGLLGVRVIVR